MNELTDKQIEILGTAIGAEIVRKFSANQSYEYGGGWVDKLVKRFAKSLVEDAPTNLQSNTDYFASLGKRIFGKGE